MSWKDNLDKALNALKDMAESKPVKNLAECGKSLRGG